MLLVHRALERTALKSIASSPPKVSGYLLSSLDESHFHAPANRETFQRIRKLARDRGHLVSWDDVLSDPALSQTTRTLLSVKRSKRIKLVKNAESLVTRLNEYRKLREIYFAVKATGESLKADKIDIDDITQKLADGITRARTNGNTVEKMFTHFGKNNNSAKVVKNILLGDTKRFIPTGFKNFDSKSIGIPRGSLWALGGPTGSGKCLEKNTKIPTNRGIFTLEQLWNMCEGPTDNEGFRKLHKPIRVYTHKGRSKKIWAVYCTTGKTIRITMSNGAVVEGLAEHKIWILNERGIPEFKRLDQLSIGDNSPNVVPRF